MQHQIRCRHHPDQAPRGGISQQFSEHQVPGNTGCRRGHWIDHQSELCSRHQRKQQQRCAPCARRVRELMLHLRTRSDVLSEPHARLQAAPMAALVPVMTAAAAATAVSMAASGRHSTSAAASGSTCSTTIVTMRLYMSLYVSLARYAASGIGRMCRADHHANDLPRWIPVSS